MGAESSAERWEQANQRFLEQLRRDREAAGYAEDQQLAPLLRRTARGRPPDKSTVSRLLRGERIGITRPPQPGTNPFAEPMVKRLFEGLGVPPTINSELGRCLVDARREFIRWQRQWGDAEGGLQLAGLHAPFRPLVPPEALRAIGRVDPRRALRCAVVYTEQPQRGRALAYLLEGNAEHGQHIDRYIERQIRKLQQELQHQLDHGTPTVERGRPRPVDVIHAALTLGVAQCRAGRIQARQGGQMILSAGMLAFALDDDVQRCQALSAAATAANLAAASGSAPFGRHEETSHEWIRAALTTAQSLSGRYVATVLARAAVARSMARSERPSVRADARALLRNLEDFLDEAPDHQQGHRARSAIADSWTRLNLEHACELADQLPPGAEHDRARGAIAIAAVEAGRWGVADRALEFVEDPWERARVLGVSSHFRNLQAATHESASRAQQAAEDAIQVVLDSPEPQLVVYALAALVPPLAVSPAHRELAVSALDRAINLAHSPRLAVHDQAHALAALAVAAAHLGKGDLPMKLYKGAQQRADKLDEIGTERIHALVAVGHAAADIAAALVDQNDSGSTTRGVANTGVSSHLPAVEPVLEKAGDALHHAKDHSDPLELIYALSAIAGLNVRCSDLESAARAVDEGWQLRQRLRTSVALDLAAFVLIEHATVLDGRESQDLVAKPASIQDSLLRSKAFAAMAAACAPGDPGRDAYLRMAKSTRERLGAFERDWATIKIAEALTARDDPDELERARGEVESLTGHGQAEGWAMLASAYSRQAADGRAREAMKRALGESRPPWAAVNAIVAGSHAIVAHVSKTQLRQLIDQAAEAPGTT